MKYLAILAITLSSVLSGCATTIRSDVTAFHQWPAQIQDKSYAFLAPAPPEDTLEYRSYMNLVRAELATLGFKEADPATARLRVGMRFSTVDRLERVIESMDPFFTGRGYWPGRYYGYGYPWRYSRFGYSPFYDPFFHGPVDLRESIRHHFERQLKVTINGVDGKKLYDVTVRNNSLEPNTPVVMPALVHSAFAGFPGQSGVPHRVDLKLE